MILNRYKSESRRFLGSVLGICLGLIMLEWIAESTAIAQAIILSDITTHPTVVFSVASQLANNTIRPEKVIQVVTTDWNGDGGFDRALLIESETEPDQVDLLIYLSNSSQTMSLALRKGNVAWRGNLWGTQPSLELTPSKSLVIKSGNEAMGRGRWNQKLTVVYQNQLFIVAGYTYTHRDTLDLAAGGICDVNLLTGKGFKNRKFFTPTTKPIRLENWADNDAYKECRF